MGHSLSKDFKTDRTLICNIYIMLITKPKTCLTSLPFSVQTADGAIRPWWRGWGGEHRCQEPSHLRPAGQLHLQETTAAHSDGDGWPGHWGWETVQGGSSMKWGWSCFPGDSSVRTQGCLKCAFFVWRDKHTMFFLFRHRERQPNISTNDTVSSKNLGSLWN